jgi:ribosomal protein S18 acetylase RimI-like enzyme
MGTSAGLLGLLQAPWPQEGFIEKNSAPCRRPLPQPFKENESRPSLMKLAGSAHGRDPGISVARLDESSMDDAIRLHNEIFPINYTLVFFERLRVSHNRFCFLFVLGQEHIGICTFKVENRFGYIMTLGIRSRYRRKGLGTICMRIVEDYLGGELGAAVLHLHVQECNLAALEFYKHCGFEVAGLEPRYYATITPRAAYRLRKDICSA